MKRINRLLLIAFLIVPLIGLSISAYALPVSEAETIQANARQAVDDALAQLQAALAKGDPPTVQLAQQTLDLAIVNYATASDALQQLINGQQVPDSVFLGCDSVADQITAIIGSIAVGELNAAQLAYNNAADIYAGLPPPANPGQIPGGLGDIAGQILAASTQSATITAGGGTPAGKADNLGTNTASPI